MTKRILSIIFIIILITSSIVQANAGPTYWEGNPSMEALTIEEDSLILVESENLTFDFTRPELANYNDYSKFGLVTAAYEMANPTDENLKVQMAFPIISKIGDFRPEDIEIREDGLDIPFEIFIGGSTDGIVNKANEDEESVIDFDKILSSITRGTYIPESFKLDDMAELHTFHIENTSQDGLHFVVDFSPGPENIIISDGFNSFSGNQEENFIEIGSYIHNKETIELLLVGEEIEFNINVYSDPQTSEKTDEFILTRESRVMTVEDYLTDYFDEIENEFYKGLPYQQLLNQYYKQIDDIRESTRGSSYMWIDEFTSFKHYDLFLVLLYEVDFMPGESKDISVSYMTKGTMDRRNSVDPLYSFEYILNPAGKWADFKDLSIEIIPPRESPYIIESSLEFSRDEDGSYRGTYERLPENDLTFTLYSKDKVTFMDRVAGFLDRSIYLVYPVVIAAVVAAGYLTIRVIPKVYKNRKDK